MCIPMIIIIMFISITDCSTVPSYDKKIIRENEVIEFQEPSYTHGIDPYVSTAIILGGTIGVSIALYNYGYRNPVEFKQNDGSLKKEQGTTGSLYAISGAIITLLGLGILLEKILKYDVSVKHGYEKDWLRNYNDGLKNYYERLNFINANFLPSNSVSTIFATTRSGNVVQNTNNKSTVTESNTNYSKFITNNIGTWKGTGNQIDNNSKWDIEIKIINEKQILISYPTLRCGGNLKLIKQSDVSAEFEELIEYGKNNCVNNGKILLTNEGWSATQFRYYFKDGKYGAYGQLFKVEGKEQVKAKGKEQVNGDSKAQINDGGKEQDKNVNIFQKSRIIRQPGITSFDISPDNKYIVTSSEDKTIKLWDISTGDIVYTLFEPTDELTSVCFSSDGKYIFSGTTSQKLSKWDATNGYFLFDISKGIDNRYDYFENYILQIKCSINGDYLNVGNGWNFGFYSIDLKNGKKYNFNTENKISIYNLDIDNKNNIAIVCSELSTSDKQIRILNFPSLNIYRTFKMEGEPTDVKFSPDGNYIFCSSRYIKKISIFKISNQQLIDVYNTPYEFNYSVDISPDSKYLTTASNKDGYHSLNLLQGVKDKYIDIDNEILIWELKTKNKIYSIPGKGSIYKLKFSSNGKYLVAQYYNILNIYDVSSLNIDPKKDFTEGLDPKPDNQGPIIKESDIDTEIPITKNYQQNTYALIIGNEDYTIHHKNLSSEENVRYAKKDAELFKKYCVNTLGIPEENITLLKDEISTKIELEITKLSQKAKYQSGVKLIFYYAGHGAPDIENRESYILPVDVSDANINRGIQLSQLFNTLTEYSPIRVTAFIDACFSKSLIASRGVRVQPKPNTLYGNIIVFSATSEIQEANYFDEQQHGLFTYYLIKKIKENKGNVTYGELFDYLKQYVPLKAYELFYKEQNPGIEAGFGIKPFWRSFKFNE